MRILHGHYSFPVRSREVALRLEEGNGDIRDSVDRLGDTEHGRGHSGGQDVRCPCATKKGGESEMQGKPLHNKEKRTILKMSDGDILVGRGRELRRPQRELGDLT